MRKALNPGGGLLLYRTGYGLKSVVVAVEDGSAASARRAAEECVANGSDLIVGPADSRHTELVAHVAGASGESGFYMPVHISHPIHSLRRVHDVSWRGHLWRCLLASVESLHC